MFSKLMTNPANRKKAKQCEILGELFENNLLTRSLLNDIGETIENNLQTQNTKKIEDKLELVALLPTNYQLKVG